MVAVLSKTGIRLMPTSSYRARKLLAKKKAVICGYRPFTIVSQNVRPGTYSRWNLQLIQDTSMWGTA